MRGESGVGASTDNLDPKKAGRNRSADLGP
jgi:hypothetical protein